MTEKICILTNESKNTCGTNIQITNSTQWSFYLVRNETNFLIVTSDRTITQSQFENALNKQSHVLSIDHKVFKEKIVPYIGKEKTMTLSFKRTRNCSVMQQSYYLYIVSSIIYVIILLIWFRMFFAYHALMLDCQKFITFLLVVRVYCDLTYILHVMVCTATGSYHALEQLVYGINTMLQPIFQGAFVFLIMSFAMVRKQ